VAVINIRAGGALVAACVLAAAAGAAPADATSAAGRTLAERDCAPCHAVGPTGASPVAAAPPFRTFAARWPVEHLREALAEGVMVGHGGIEMPEVALAPEQIDDLLAHLAALAGAGDDAR